MSKLFKRPYDEEEIKEILDSSIVDFSIRLVAIQQNQAELEPFDSHQLYAVMLSHLASVGSNLGASGDYELSSHLKMGVAAYYRAHQSALLGAIANLEGLDDATAEEILSGIMADEDDTQDDGDGSDVVQDDDHGTVVDPDDGVYVDEDSSGGIWDETQSDPDR